MYRHFVPPLVRKLFRDFNLAFTFLIIAVLAASALAQDAVPSINEPLVPDAVVPGGAGFNLTVNGTGFVAGASQLYWNGSVRPTTIVSGTKLTAAIAAADIATASTAAITVVTPGPGGGRSNIVFLPIATAETNVQFTKNDLASDGGNIQVVTADFDGDGKLDLATADYYDSVIRIFLGNGDGTFRVGPAFSSCNAHGLAVGDFNGDGIPDLAVANAGCGEVSVFLGNGDGSFQSSGTFSIGGRSALSPYSVAVGDFDGDGKLDLVTANELLNNASVFLGNGDGTFQEGVQYESGHDSRKVVTGDFNGDGFIDFAISSSQGVSVRLGKGTGDFEPEIFHSLSTSDNPYMLTADLNGDGKLDFAVVNTAGSVTVMLGNGDGTFGTGTLFPTGGYSVAVAAADLNDDGIPDLITTRYDGVVAVLLGNGDGTFQAPVTYTGESGARGLDVGDFNRDGRLDLAVGNQFVSTLSIFLQNTLPATATTLTSSLNPSPFGQAVTFTATVSSSAGTPAGTVIFYDEAGQLGSVELTNGSASLSTSSLPAGSHFVTAIYQGSTVFAGSSSAKLNQVVNANKIYHTRTQLFSSRFEVFFGDPVTFTAYVSSFSGQAPPDGEMVGFYVRGRNIGDAPLQGGTAILTTTSLPAGRDLVSAIYFGDANFRNSGTRITEVVNKYSTTTALASSPNPVMYGDPVTYTATVTSTGPDVPTGFVRITNLGKVALVGGVATFTKMHVRAGTHAITAQYLGDAARARSISAVLHQISNPALTTATITSSSNPASVGQLVTFTATVTPSTPVNSYGKVTFTAGTTTLGIATLKDNLASISTSALPAGVSTITVTYAGTPSFVGSSASMTQTVNP